MTRTMQTVRRDLVQERRAREDYAAGKLTRAQLKVLLKRVGVPLPSPKYRRRAQLLEQFKSRPMSAPAIPLRLD